MESTLISIIIPCYNHGHFIQEAIDSVEKCDSSLYEMIIVNDGSVDPNTIEVLKNLETKGYRVINQTNQGLAKTRNNGIRVAKGKYILPLDADNRIRPEYLIKGVQVFNQNPEVSVVYGKSEFFDQRTGIPAYTSAFNLQKLMLNNYIDACAIFRKEAWEKVGGFDENMPAMGYEDWDFWMKIAFSGGVFHFIDEVVFDYRYREDSMSRVIEKKKRALVREYVEKKHSKYLSAECLENYYSNRFKSNPLLFITKIILSTYFSKTYNNLLQKKKINRL